MFLSETKNPDEAVLKHLEWLDYTAKYLVSPHGHGGGGLALFWKDDIELEILSSNHNYIDTKVKYEGNDFFATFVYGEPDIAKRRNVWEQLSQMASNRDSPWFLTRDFNEILDNSEKHGGKTRAEPLLTSDPSSRRMTCLIYNIQATSYHGGEKETNIQYYVDLTEPWQIVHGMIKERFMELLEQMCSCANTWKKSDKRLCGPCFEEKPMRSLGFAHGV